MRPHRPHRRAAHRPRLAAVALLALLVAAVGAPGRGRAAAPAPAARPSVAVFPLRVNSAKDLKSLESSLPELLRSRLAASGRVEAPATPAITGAPPGGAAGDPTDTALRRLGREVGVDWVVSASLTELAGRFSLDARVVPVDAKASPQGFSFTAQSEDDLLDRVNELSERVLDVVSHAGRATVVELRIEGGEGVVDAEARAKLRTKVGQPYDAAVARADLTQLRSLPGVATASLETEPRGTGVAVTFRVVGTERIFGARAPTTTGDRVAEIRIVGNRRIEADAIRARISTKAGDPYRPAQVALDVREVFTLGFFRDVTVASQSTPDGRIVTFTVVENPVVRQVAITGNESLDAEKIRNALTITTGSTLDYPLLYENTARIEALYRAEGYYLAKVRHKIDTLSPDAVAVDFQVEEGKKLRLKEIRFEGNQALTTSELTSGLKTKPWHFYSYVTKYLDNSGTYSEPIFLQDLRTVEQKYTDRGYLQVEIGEPRVEPEEDGLVVIVDVKEGDQFSVGTIAVKGDETVDQDKLRQDLKLKQGEIFNRSYLTQDVEQLTQYFTNRGFYFASVNPQTLLSSDKKIVDVTFDVQRGPLYFIRQVDVQGNTTTLDDTVRREVQVVEGQLYSARAIQISKQRLQNLGFFEEVNFEPKPTDYQSQLDLDVKVVEKPTGSLSFGAGFSSQDKFIVSGSLSQSNLFGRGWGAQVSADIGGSADRFYLSFSDPYLWGSDFGFSGTLFLTDVQYQDFTEKRYGVDLSVGHALNEENTARGIANYNFSIRKIDESTSVNAASLIFREVFQGDASTSQFGLTFRSEELDDRLAPKKGFQTMASMDYAGLFGFASFLRGETKASWFMPLPDWWPISNSTFLLAGRAGYTLPFNSIGDYNLPEPAGIGGDKFLVAEGDPNIRALNQIDTNLKLPLTERYFLGGLGSFQLRGYRARSVGPRRTVLTRNQNIFGEQGFAFFPVGYDPASHQCFPAGVTAYGGDGSGKCNNISDTKNKDFANLDQTDVIGGSKYISLTAEYRFPISETLGLVGIVFLDAGNAFAENESIFGVSDWRYGTGVGALWFSPFGPLQAFYGIPLNKLSVEDSSVFEFSVGGANF